MGKSKPKSQGTEEFKRNLKEIENLRNYLTKAIKLRTGFKRKRPKKNQSQRIIDISFLILPI